MSRRAYIRLTRRVPRVNYRPGETDHAVACHPARTQPVPGDVRLLVTLRSRRTTAALFHAVVPGTKEPVKYASPIGSAQIDRVEDVSGQVLLAVKKRVEDTGKKKKGIPVLITYTEAEFAISLATLGLAAPHAGETLTGDVGLLLGQPGVTADRVY